MEDSDIIFTMQYAGLCAHVLHVLQIVAVTVALLFVDCLMYDLSSNFFSSFACFHSTVIHYMLPPSTVVQLRTGVFFRRNSIGFDCITSST